jgi:hypothetical protein
MGIPQNGRFIMENPLKKYLKNDDMGYPYCRRPPNNI